MRRQDGAAKAVEGQPVTAGACRTGTGWTVQDMIWLTARFNLEWFRSFDTLEADLERFAALYRLGAEEIEQVRTAIQALRGEE